MIVDTSAIMAIILEEPEAPTFLRLIATAERPRMSAGSWLELSIVLARRAVPEVATKVVDIFKEFDISIEAVTSEQAMIGSDAYRRYGRASRHPADLNFGDCFAYALAIDTGEPLLFKGDDFVHTDVRRPS